MSTKPIYIYEGGGSNPHIIASIDTDKYSDHDSRAESAVISRQVNNISTIEIVIPANCEASKAITNTSDLVLYDTNGNLQEFHITDIDDADEYSVTRTIYAELSFGELINSVIIGDASMPTSTNPADYLAYILSFTRWSVGTVDSGIYNSKWDEDITGLTCLEAFQKLIDKYNCEFVIRYETDGKNKITGRYVDLKKSIGHNYGKRFEDSKDILGLKSSLDLDSIRTAIYPRIRKDYMDDNGNSRTEYVDISSVVWSVAAGDPVDKPAGQTVLVNPDAETIYKRYNTKDGKLMERVMYAEWTNESAIDAEDLCSQAWAILKANGTLNPTIKVTAGDLYRMSGDDPDYSHEQVDLGDTCIIIDRNFEPELRLTTRVMEMEEDILNPVNNTYVFGNYRKTLATSNIESQKSVEEQLTDLYNKLQGVKVDYELPYQSGKKPYQEIKENVMNDFMSASGYVMAEDSDGFWVLDAPVSTYSLRARTAASPTKAVILKGGMLGFAEYNSVKSQWEMGTFIDGMSVNADYINTGHLNADVISAGSITTDHLSTATVEYIKTGMATDDDLQGVIDSVAKDYATKDSVSSNINDAVKDLVSNSDMNTAISDATKDLATNSSVSSNINNAVKDLVSNSDMNSAITDATKDMATNSSVSSAISNATADMATNSSVNSAISSATQDMEEQNKITRINAIKDLQKQLQAEYSENNSKATKIYADQYLPAGSTAKVNLNNKMTAYTTAYNNYNNYITTMIDDGTITEDEYSQYNTYATAYATAVKELAEAMEDANSARLANVYAQARQGLVTTAELEVNNESVIASAKAGMVSTGDMTGAITAATENLVSSDALNTAVTNATKDMATNSSVNTAVNNIQVGTRNLVVNSNFYNNFTNWDLKNSLASEVMVDTGTKYNGHNTVKISVSGITDYAWKGFRQLLNSRSTPTKGKTYTISLMSYATNVASIDESALCELKGYVSSVEEVISSVNIKPDANNTWTRRSFTVTLVKNYDSFFVYPFVNKNGTIWVTDITVTEGNKVVPWSPAPEDATNYTDNAVKDKVTTTQMNSAVNNATKDMATNSSVNSAISSATADMATNTGVTNAINGITVGSRNLALLTSDEWVSFTGFSGAENDCRLSYTVLTNGLSVNDKMLVAFDYKLENMTYTSDKSPTIRIQGSGNVTEWNAGQFPIVNINLSGKPANATGTAYTIATIDQNNIKNGCWYCNFRTDYITGGTVSIKGIRVIRSSKLVSWVAAPEDAYTNTVFETFKAVTAEYNNNYKVATTLYSNSYLGGTAKTNLKTAYDDYATKYNAVKSAHDAISTYKHAGEGRKTTWNTALTNLQSSTTTLALRVQEASTFINTAVYNASKNYTDGAIPDALTGYAKTSYVDAAKADAIADAKNGMVSTSQLEVNNTEILMKTASMGQYNMLRNTDFRDGTNYWVKYVGTSAPSSFSVVTDSDEVVISGEKALRTWHNTGTNPIFAGYYQDVTLQGGTSYTLSYWLASYNCTARISVWKGTANDNMIANKNHNQCNGGHNRSNWIYDSITFTTSTAGTYRMFFQVYNTNNAAGYGLFLIKPMLCTGINAQAWTAHPDEIHVGVVSITEQNGIKVEHSDFSTYSVLNAAGLKVLTNSNSLVASFGESGSAYIGDLTCDGYVKSPQVMPVSKKVNGGIINIYCSETGSGNFSGDSSNYVMGWAGAMRKVLDYLGIDYTHTEGGFVINTNTSDKNNLTFRIFIKGSTFTNNIELYNIYGHATFEIRFDSGCKYTGQMRFCDLEPEVTINGAGKAVLHRGTSEDYAVYCYNVKRFQLSNIYINYTNASSYNYPIYAYNTNCLFTTVDFCNCGIMASIDNCYLEASYCVGSMNRYISGGNLSFINLPSNKVPAVSASAPYGSAANVSSMTSYTPTSSAQQGSQPVTINVTKTYNCETYASFRTATYRPGILLQGSPSADELNKYGNYYGRIYFAKAVIAEALNTITNPVVTLYLERASAISSATDYVDIYIAGSYAGELQGDKSSWFTLSTTAINSIKNNGYVEINGTGVDNYTQFKTNAVLKITGTQTK